jgi:hypothetical protein
MVEVRQVVVEGDGVLLCQKRRDRQLRLYGGSCYMWQLASGTNSLQRKRLCSQGKARGLRAGVVGLIEQTCRFKFTRALVRHLGHERDLCHKLSKQTEVGWHVADPACKRGCLHVFLVCGLVYNQERQWTLKARVRIDRLSRVNRSTLLQLKVEVTKGTVEWRCRIWDSS